MRISIKPYGDGRARIEGELGAPIFELTTRTNDRGDLTSAVTVDISLARDIALGLDLLDTHRRIARA